MIVESQPGREVERERERERVDARMTYAQGT
jgi:hypothetical protein